MSRHCRPEQVWHEPHCWLPQDDEVEVVEVTLLVVTVLLLLLSVVLPYD